MTVAQIFDPDPEDNYLVHSVQAMSSCLAYLRSRPDVDPDRIFFWGISWGAVISTLAAASDPRVAGIALFFGAGYITEESIWLRHLQRMGKTAVSRWRQLVDPAEHIAEVGCPVFAITGTNDACFPLTSFVRTWTSARDDRFLLLRPGLNHRVDQTAVAAMWTWLQAQASSRPLTGPRVTIKALPFGDRARIHVVFGGTHEPRSVRVWWTEDPGGWHRAHWRSISPRSLDGSYVATIPEPFGEVFVFCEMHWNTGLVNCSTVYTVTRVAFEDRHRWLAVWGIRRNLHVVPRGWLQAALGLIPKPHVRMASLDTSDADLVPIREAARACNASVRRLADGTLTIIPNLPPPVVAEAAPMSPLPLRPSR
ncbi:MAG: dienelactone hydrolase family protein [Armatimonadetes bacterium]|nr:dienelactone hydrolase family protein [Armatimonadota bacterium]